MKFEVNRLEMLEVAKKAARVAPLKAPLEVLNGILLESREDSGDLFMTATNLEVSIQQKMKVSIGDSGTMLVHPRLLVGMLSLLPGEFVAFSSDNPDALTVTGGKCVYGLNCLSSKRYPKPVMPFPEETVKLSGICSLARRTVFATSKDTHKPVLQCVNLQLRHNAVHAAACDGAKLMLVRNEARSPVNQEFLVPAEALQILASISTDEDVFEVGDIGGQIVFTRDSLMFTTRKIEGDFIDTASIVKSITPAYTAVIDATRMKEALSIISVCEDNEPVNIILSDGQMILRRNSDYSEARTTVPANISTDTPDNGFYYNIHHLQKLFQVMDGKIRLELDAKGMMLVKSRSEVYVQTPLRAPVSKPKSASSKNKAMKEAA